MTRLTIRVHSKPGHRFAEDAFDDRIGQSLAINLGRPDHGVALRGTLVSWTREEDGALAALEMDVEGLLELLGDVDLDWLREALGGGDRP